MKNTNIQPFKKGYKFRIYPNKEQEEYFAKLFGSCRFVYNKLLSDTIEEYKLFKNNPELPKPKISGIDLCYRIPVLKSNNKYSWLKEQPAHVLQNAVKNLGVAYANFFKRKIGYPKFKSKHGRQSAIFNTVSYTLKDKVLKLAKLDSPVKVKWSRELPSAPNTLTISKTPSGKYYVSFICEYTPVKTNGIDQIGIDLGIKDFLVISNGIKISNPKYLESKQKKLAKYQRRLSSKKKGSKNRNKEILKVAKLHEKITNSRNDFLHKLSRKLINENQVIGIENLRVSNMVRNHKLAKAISSAAWSKFCDMLNYKSKESQCCSIVYMDTFFPSTHICNTTGLRLDRKLKLSERTWKCPHCDEIHDRDVNAAKNIKNEALLTLALHRVPDKSGIVLKTRIE